MSTAKADPAETLRFSAQDIFQLLRPDQIASTKTKLFWRFSKVMSVMRKKIVSTVLTNFRKFKGGTFFRAAVHKDANNHAGVFVQRRGKAECNILFELAVYDQAGVEVIREEFKGEWKKDGVEFLGGISLLEQLPEGTREVLIVVSFHGLEGSKPREMKRTLEDKEKDMPPAKKPALEPTNDSFTKIKPERTLSTTKELKSCSPPLDKDLALTVCEWAWVFDDKKCRELFASMDTDKNQYIDSGEFIKAMKVEMDDPPSDMKLLDIFNAIDDDKSGEIDYDEFMQWLVPSAELGLALKAKGEKAAKAKTS